MIAQRLSHHVFALFMCKTVLGLQTSSETSLFQSRVELRVKADQSRSFQSVLHPHHPQDVPSGSPLPHIGCGTTQGIVFGVFAAIALADSILYFYPHWWTRQKAISGEQTALWDTHRLKAVWTLVCYIGALNVAIQLEFLFSLFVRQATVILSEDESIVNCAFTIFLICNGLLGPFFAKLAAKCGMRLMMLTSLVGTLVTYAGLTILPCLVSFFACYLLGGLSMACLYSTCSISAMRVMPPHLQSIVVGFLSCMNMGLSALVSLALRPINHSFGIRMGYGLLGAILVIMQAIFTFTLPSEGDRLCIEADETPKETTKETIKETTKKADSGDGVKVGYLKIIPLYIVFFIDMLGLYFWEGQFQVILNQTQTRYAVVRQFGAPILFVLCAFSRFAWGAIAAKTSAMLCMTISSATFTVSFVVWAIFLGNSSGTLLGLILTAVTMASHFVLMPIMVMRTVDKESATFLYSVLMTAELGGISAPLTAGLFDTVGPKTTLLVCCSAPALSTVIKLVAIKWDRATAVKKPL